MIKRIELENFFSFGEKRVLALNPGVNMLVGINGSGKSNFLKAISFLGEGMRDTGSIQKLMNSWGGFDTVCNYSSSQKDIIRLCFELDKEQLKQTLDGKGFLFPNNPIYEIEIHRIGATDYFLKERVYNISNTKGQADFIYLEMNSGRGFVSERDESTGKNSLKRKDFNESNENTREYYDTPEEAFNSRELVVKQISDPKRYFPLLTLKRAIETIAVYPYFDTSFTSEIRKYQEDTTDNKLQLDGQNLFPIIQYLARNFSLDYDRLEETITKVNPAFKGIRQDVRNGRIGIVLAEKNLTRAIPIQSISDGTLQFLLLMTIFYNPSRGRIVCIDEPEKGLHPDMIRLIADMMRYAAGTNTQVIVSTHNSLLLNTFELDDLWLFEKDEQNQTVVLSKTEEEIEKWVDNFSPGDLWLRGLIGARVSA